MTLVWEEGACKGAEELSVGVGKQLSKERRCNEGMSSPQQPGLKVFKNSRVMRCPKHQSWALSISLELWMLNTSFSFAQQVKIII